MIRVVVLRLTTPGAPLPLILIAVMLLGLYVGQKVLKPTRNTSAVQAYLSWLNDATLSLQGEVQAGERQEAPNVAAAIAVGGPDVATTGLAGLPPLFTAFADRPR